MSDPLELFLKDLLAGTNADEVTITDDNASAENPLPNLLMMDTSEISLSLSSLQNSSSSLDSMTSSGSSRWDSMPNTRGDSYKAKLERIPKMPRRSLEEKESDFSEVKNTVKWNDSDTSSFTYHNTSR